ncbi:fibroblast growth factor receptor 1-like isoform X2 [Daphnia pulex]|uniref:fibroblast growth factor receptor 1-like isoform X2 n=1 Tax=Daphnia pulex TaxID=6669 RepID=UPI001EDE151C|nr:fibroblast growth factor receptor 1-like isoform X2 [Daphnia pulex]
MFALFLLLSVSTNGLSPLIIGKERTTPDWIKCPSHIGPSTKCFSNSKMDCYCLVSKKMIREDASQHCRDNNMHLLSIETQEENEFVINLVKKNDDLITNQFWTLGYNANLDPNNWGWQQPNLNVSKPLTYKNWCRGSEPDNGFENEHFIAVINRCWHDVPGHFDWASVCEREANIFDPNLDEKFFFTFPGEHKAVVPCRPATNFDLFRVNVSKEIKKPTNVYHQIILNGTSGNKNYEYDPLEGFVIKNVSVSDNGTYKCSIFLGMQEAWQHFHVITTVLKADPRWDPSEGTDVTLTCNTQKLKLGGRTVDPVEWSVVFAISKKEKVLTPTNAAAMLPIGVQLKFNDGMENGISTLKISNVSIAMSGTYRCRSVFHGFNNSVQLTSNNLSINVLRNVVWSDKISRKELKGILTPATTNAENYRVIPVGSDLRISCSFGTSGHLRYYQWQWEQFDDNPQYTSERNDGIWSRLTVTRNKNSVDSTDNFTMLLTNVERSDRGLFTCLLNGSPSTSISQYIYVDDRHQSAEHANFDLVRSSWRNTYIRTHGQLAVIPCRPVHPSIGMDILKISKEEEIKLIISNGTTSDDNYEYNPQKGFIIHRLLPEHDELRSSTSFQCKAAGGKIEAGPEKFSIMVIGASVECTKGCWSTSSERINGLLNARVNPAELQQGEHKIELNCHAYLSNNESAVIEWFVISDGGEVKISYSKAKAGITLSYSWNKKMKVQSSTLTISNVTDKSFGIYKCFVKANMGNYFDSINLQASFKSPADPTVTNVSVSVTIVVVFIFVAITIFLVYFRKKFTKLEHLLYGDSTQMNPDEPLDEQTDLLSYDKRWEFPRNRLRLGKQLGVGCFGRVVQAEAVGINDGTENSVSTVAVKMVRSRTNLAAIEGLVSELKILIHMGAHVNIVNLLGACTKDINRGELLVILEYCPFGNLRTFIINHRDTFVNQVNESGELIASDVENDADEVVTTRKLICWSFQIARGMDYLASKKVLHGDLAARNILLTNHNVIKVADFGLSRQLYRDENYTKKSRGLLPLKWMAIESLTNRIWSSRSDVWSYGIVLWEMFSLGQMPYQGYTDEFLFLQALKNGYRMETPEHTPNFVAKMMQDCWMADPKQRPTFSQIEELLDGPLESLVTSFYLQLNKDCQQLNIDKRTYENFSVKPVYKPIRISVLKGLISL